MPVTQSRPTQSEDERKSISNSVHFRGKWLQIEAESARERGDPFPQNYASVTQSNVSEYGTVIR